MRRLITTPNTHQLFAHTSTTVAGGSTTYVVQGKQSTSEADVITPVSLRGVVSDLRVVLTGSPGGVQTVVVTLRKNSVDTALTATLTGADASGADTTNRVYFAEGDNWDFKVVLSATANTTEVAISVAFAPVL